MDLPYRQLVWEMLAVRVEPCEASMPRDLIASQGRGVRMTSLYHPGGWLAEWESAASPSAVPLKQHEVWSLPIIWAGTSKPRWGTLLCLFPPNLGLCTGPNMRYAAHFRRYPWLLGDFFKQWMLVWELMLTGALFSPGIGGNSGFYHTNVFR